MGWLASDAQCTNARASQRGTHADWDSLEEAGDRAGDRDDYRLLLGVLVVQPLQTDQHAHADHCQQHSGNQDGITACHGAAIQGLQSETIAAPFASPTPPKRTPSRRNREGQSPRSSTIAVTTRQRRYR